MLRKKAFLGVKSVFGKGREAYAWEFSSACIGFGTGWFGTLVRLPDRAFTFILGVVLYRNRILSSIQHYLVYFTPLPPVPSASIATSLCLPLPSQP